MTIGYPDNAISKEARAKAGGGFESAIEVAAPEGQRVISGTGFGSGPNVVIFDRFTGSNFETLSSTREADVGSWSRFGFVTGEDGTEVPKLYAQDGRTWFSIRQADLIAGADKKPVAYVKTLPEGVKEFRLCHRQYTPSGFNFPGANSPGVYPTSSSYKLVWAADAAMNGTGGNTGQADLVIPTMQGNGSFLVQGNSTDTEKEAGGSVFTSGTIGSENLYGWYQSGYESSPGALDAVMEIMLATNSGVSRNNYLGNPFFPQAEDAAIKEYTGFRVPGYFGNNGGNPWSNTLSLVGDFYLATGPSSRACIIAGNASTLSACTQSYIIPPDSWADTEIKYTPVSYEALDFTHLILADGTLLENV